MTVSRCLEGPASLAYPSLEEYVDKTIWKAPRWLSYLSGAIFCSLFILVPVVLGFIVLSMIMCFRGKYLLDLMSNTVNYFFNASWSRPAAEQALSVTEHYIISAESISTLREAVSCPDSHSIVCTLCDSLHVELLGGLAIAVFVLLMVLPVPEWHGFARVFQLPYNIFNYRFLVDQNKFVGPLKSKRPMLFVVIPHGVVPIGCFMGLSYIWSYLPALKGITYVASVTLRLPIIRQIILFLGGRAADRESMHEGLSSGRHGYIMPGGIAELMMSNRHREQVYLKKRKGFVKIAQENNAILVPVYIFGHTRLFDQLANGDGIAMWFSRLIRGSVTFYWGPFFLPIPYVTKLTCMCGDPLELDWSDPEMTVDKGHAIFSQAVQTLFEAHKHEAGYGDVNLEIK
eukprot:m.237122 g.237122  ORF g.237122 m.237122 type:complete len:400 (+) comp20944_c0_seq1:53-1252(+)